MKRSHRQWHRRVWMLLLPLLVVVLGLATWWRSAEPVNSALPLAVPAPVPTQGG